MNKYNKYKVNIMKYNRNMIRNIKRINNNYKNRMIIFRIKINLYSWNFKSTKQCMKNQKMIRMI